MNAVCSIDLTSFNPAALGGVGANVEAGDLSANVLRRLGGGEEVVDPLLENLQGGLVRSNCYSTTIFTT